MNLSGLILKLSGWKLKVSVPDYPKSIICVAPHTSNWDFILGKLAYSAIGRKAGFLMKEAWFFFPLGLVFKAMGGIPVPRQKGSDLVETIVNKFNESEKMSLAITPEGTRKRTTEWRKGFIYIALQAHIPIVMAYIDFGNKEIGITEAFSPTGDVEADLRYIKNFYKQYKGKHPGNFATD